MSTSKESIKVYDNRQFVYEVTLEYKPHFGFSTAFYDGQIIADVELYRITQPMSDDDREWEMYEERFAEWTDEIKVNIIPKCENHFNQ